MRTLGVGLLFFAVIAAAAWILTTPAKIPASALPPYTTNLGNGRTMFYAGGCISCHAMQNDEGGTGLGGGRALATPFGTFYPPNISPDPHDGIGAWSEADFVTAMWKGTSPEGWHYYPAFPYTSYQHMTLNDVRDLFAYLKTLPAVGGRVREHDLPFPLRVRRVVGLWKLLFLDGKAFEADRTQASEWNRGSYLVNGPGHCAECHSPRNIIGGIVARQRFAGGPNPEGEGWVPNITAAGIGDWSKQDVEQLLASGELPDGDSVGSSMVAVVRSTSQLSAGDRAAIASYIKSLSALQGPRPPKGK
jgi:mono/diheme cytochrome c family protein